MHSNVSRPTKNFHFIKVHHFDTLLLAVATVSDITRPKFEIRFAAKTS